MLCHDPRVSNIRWEKRETLNDVLILAEMKVRQGLHVDWDSIAEAADLYDWPVGNEGKLVNGRWIPSTRHLK